MAEPLLFVNILLNLALFTQDGHHNRCARKHNKIYPCTGRITCRYRRLILRGSGLLRVGRNFIVAFHHRRQDPHVVVEIKQLVHHSVLIDGNLVRAIRQGDDKGTICVRLKILRFTAVYACLLYTSPSPRD